MSRSSKKVPFVAAKLLKRIEAMNESGKKEVIKTWSRASFFPLSFIASILFNNFTATKGTFLLDLDI